MNIGERIIMNIVIIRCIFIFINSFKIKYISEMLNKPRTKGSTLIKKEEFPFVDDQGKEAINFQISITIYMIISAILIVVVIGILLMIALGVFAIVMIIIATIKANGGEKYRYPLTIRLIK